MKTKSTFVKKTVKVFVAALPLALLLVFFEACTQGLSVNNHLSSISSAGNLSSASCSLNGVTYSSGQNYVYYTISSGTQAQCTAAQVTSSCQANTGLFSPIPPTVRFANCTVSNATTSYSTTFSKVENPISDNGKLITSTSPGVDWSGLQLGGCGCKPVAPVGVLTSGLAQSPNVASSGVGDALAVLTGTWGADQSASIVVAPFTNSGYEEVEIHLRTDPATGRGYEITWGLNNQYILIVTWNGGGVQGSQAFTYLVNQSGSQYAVSAGDTLSASIVGNVISMYRNGQLVQKYTDTNNSFTSGNPGFGFNEGSAGIYGITSFSASSP